MARVKILQKDEVDPIAREMFQKSEDTTGRVLNLFRVLAHSPKICRDWNRMGATILLKGELDKKLMELAVIRVGELAQAEYELIAHRALGMRFGLTQAQIDGVGEWKDAAVFNEVESLVLQYTDEVALNIRASDETFAQLEKHFNQREIVELTVVIGFYGMVTRTLETLQVDLET
jgi:alkylhydroperoxidase family enzyme